MIGSTQSNWVVRAEVFGHSLLDSRERRNGRGRRVANFLSDFVSSLEVAQDRSCQGAVNRFLGLGCLLVAVCSLRGQSGAERSLQVTVLTHEPNASQGDNAPLVATDSSRTTARDSGKAAARIDSTSKRDAVRQLATKQPPE